MRVDPLPGHDRRAERDTSAAEHSATFAMSWPVATNSAAIALAE